MKNRATSDDSSAVNLFPFLAVLLCTMGALLVLLVVMAQRAGQQVVSEGAPVETGETAHALESAPVSEQEQQEAEALKQQLAKVRTYQEKIRDLQGKSSSRLQDEQQRLTHLEEHGRRLEEELAKLHLASEQLKATENSQVVDQQRAERERKHLEQRIKEAKATLEEMRDAAPTKKSYAIVPYKGPNGTFRRPIFVECSAEGVVLQPEGIRLKQEDFARPLGPGNPLAAALRAAREHLNAQAAQRGETNLPDPYPMLVVRPDGIAQYSAARRAIASWDADFGYVFVEQDLPLEFSQVDPQLAKAEYHAVLQSRDMRRALVRAAPSRYRGQGAGRGSVRSAARNGSQGPGGTGLGGPGGPGDDSNRYGTFSASAEGNAGAEFAGSGGAGSSGDGAGSDGSGGSGADGDGSDGDGLGNGSAGDFGQGTGNGEEGIASSSSDGQETYAGEGGGQQTGKAGEAGGLNGQGDAESQVAEGGSPATGSANGGSSRYASGASTGNSGTGGSSSGGSSGGSAGASGQPGNASASLDSTKKQQAETSIAQTQGTDWAVRRKSLASVPMRRPIRMIIRKDRLAILPEKRVGVDSLEGGNVILLNQSLQSVSGELTTALRERIDDWGLAGNGLYWRPVLVLNVGPDAKQTAIRLLHLLKNSGVEIQTSETAHNPRRGRNHATR